MNRQLPRFELWGLAALALLGSACTPSNNVQSGAPVITEMKLIENGATVTTIPGTVAECPAAAIGAPDGGGIAGGMCDPTVTICKLTSASNWCRCVPNPAPAGPPAPPPNCVDGSVSDAAVPTPDAGATDAGAADAGADAASDAAAPLGGTWSCPPFSPDTMVLYVFDRLLDTATLGDGGASTVPDLASLTLTPMLATPVTLNAAYNSNGAPNSTLWYLEGDVLDDGPGLLFMAQPELPQNSIVSMALDPTKVRAKDGHTPFAGTGLLNGTFAFATGGFSAAITAQPTPMQSANVCAPPVTTVVPDTTPIVVTFSNLVDPAMIAGHVTLTFTPVAGGAAKPITPSVTSADGLNVNIGPTTTWPASSVITFTLDATAADLLGETIGAPGLSTSFTTGAM